MLFNAYAGRLWARFLQQSRRALATTTGLPRDVAASPVRMVFAKVAEFQARGVVHLHAVVRLDGLDGPASLPQPGATAALLELALRNAARRVTIAVPGTRQVPARSLRWGRQLDLRPIAIDGGLSEIVVARYVAKYATKAAEVAGIDLGPIFCRVCDGYGAHPVRDQGAGRLLCRRCSGTGRRPDIDLRELGDHARRLVETCWWLGGQPVYAGLRLRRHAHTFGFRGHFATTSRDYSTTLTALRAERLHWTHAQRAAGLGLEPEAVLVVGDWRYTGRAGEAGAV
ncbi:hypothetical protein Ade02nite_00990 [Paractinoplanes deccanensis]|uniref:Replication initiation protein n=1 Tax=Paractinoplanes deccanensis TaxID=113561 RepID=A0ABQ3XUP2_9ACTN|nr:replication initiator [Actinoplanes deccanensis]GID71458.1 hypothetical protein Ade02nite_00990 [Actinoplanes deccanensis]